MILPGFVKPAQSAERRIKKMTKKVLINEVGLRDGLQIQQKFVPTEGKLELGQALIDAGVRAFEAVSFVSPKAVPQMSTAGEVWAGLPMKDEIYYSALVLNEKGYDRAMDSGAKVVSMALASTNKMNEANIRLDLESASAMFVKLIKRAKDDGVETRGYVSTAMGCPYEGDVPVETVVELTKLMLDAGADKISIADTIGSAHPEQCKRIFATVVEKWGADIFGAHLHDTRALALPNAWAALEEGIREFDSSIGGLGGCPFAPGAKGNVATEDLVFMLEQSGYETGIDVGGLLRAVGVAERLVGLKLGGRITEWWLSQERKKAKAAAEAA
jgi:hydroxymethylglutaryl-CoA lyase